MREDRHLWTTPLTVLLHKTMTKNQLEKMFDKATDARENAYAAKTEHKIGASVLTTSGEIYGGCNIESNISGLGSCAERVAIANAIPNGNYSFQALLVLDREHIIPCGACRQYLCEFMAIGGHDINIFSATLDGHIKKYSLKKLLPQAYYSKNKEKIQSYKDKERLKHWHE